MGEALAKRLSLAGHKVYGLCRTVPESAPYTPLLGDVTHPESLTVIPEALDGLVYCVGAGAQDEAAYKAAYYSGLNNVLHVINQQATPPKRIIFVSSSGVFHQQDGSIVDESSLAEATRPATRWLLTAEALLYASPLPGCVVRFSGIYGPGRTRIIDQVRAGTAVCTLPDNTILNHIHRDDCAGILEHLLNLPEPHALYLGTDCESVSRNTCYRWIAERCALSKPPEIESNETTAGPTRGGNRRYSNQRLLDSGYIFRYPTYREGYAALLTPESN